MSTPSRTHLWPARALCAALVLAAPSACGAPERLGAEATRTLALREISGLAAGTLPDRGLVVAAVGDEARAVTLAPLGADGPDLTRAVAVPLPLPELQGGSQLEAVAIARDHVFVLSEATTPTLTELALDASGARVVDSAPLEVRPDHPLAAAWNVDPNERGEGLVIEADHVLVAKQRSPAAIIAFTRQGDAWVAGTWWSVDAPDVSDLARGPDGAIYMIGAAAQSVCRLAALPAAGGAVACEGRWGLPDDLGKGKTQWEGLAFLPDGRPLVAVDRKKHDTPNLAILPRLERKP